MQKFIVHIANYCSSHEYTTHTHAHISIKWNRLTTLTLYGGICLIQRAQYKMNINPNTRIVEKCVGFHSMRLHCSCAFMAANIVCILYNLIRIELLAVPSGCRTNGLSLVPMTFILHKFSHAASYDCR